MKKFLRNFLIYTLVLTMLISGSAFPILADELDKAPAVTDVSETDENIAKPETDIPENTDNIDNTDIAAKDEIISDETEDMQDSTVEEPAVDDKSADGQNVDGQTAEVMSLDEAILESQSLELNGYFTLKVTLKDGVSKVVDVYSGSIANKANVQIYSDNNSLAQVFYIEKVDDTAFKIINAKSGKALDVYGASKSDGANIWQYTYNGTAAQLWYIAKGNDGKYSIINKGSGKSLDVYGGRSANGTNVQQYKYNGSPAQRFELVSKKVDIKNCSISGIASSYEYNGTAVVPKLTITNAGKTLKENVDYTVACSGNDGSSTIASATIKGIGMYTGSVSKQFVVINVVSGAKIQKGYYNISVTLKDGVAKVIDVRGGSTADGANIDIYAFNGSTAQQFYIEPVGNAYKIKNVKSGKLIDVYGGKTDDKVNIWQYHDNGTDAQLWYILNDSKGTYALINKRSGKSMDVYAGLSADLTNVWQYAYNGSEAQRFKVKGFTPDISKAAVSGINAGYIYTGSEIKPEPTVKYGAVKLVKDVDYSLSYANNTGSSGTATVTITGKGNFKGSVTKSFRVVKTSDSASVSFDEEKLYYIYYNAPDGMGKVLDVYGGSTADQANISLYSPNGTAAQKFRFKKVGDAYQIINVKSGKLIDVSGGKTDDKINVWQYRDNGTNAQLWYPIKNSDGSYSFINKKSLKALDVAGGGSANFTNVWQYTYNGSAAQKFTLSQAPVVSSTGVQPNWERAFFAPYESGAAQKAGNGPDAYGVDSAGNFAIGWFQATIGPSYIDYDVHDTLNVIYNYDPGKFSELKPFLNMTAKQLYNNPQLEVVWHRLNQLYWNEMFYAQQLEVDRHYLQPALNYFNQRGINMSSQSNIVKGALSSAMVRWGTATIYNKSVEAIRAAVATGNQVKIVEALYDARKLYNDSNPTSGKVWDNKRIIGERACAVDIAKGVLNPYDWIMTKKPYKYNEG